MNYLALAINGTPIPVVSQIPTGGTWVLQGVINRGITIFLVTAAVMAVFIFIHGGILWIMSGGEQQKIARARTRIIYGILGLVLILFSFFIVYLIKYSFRIASPWF
jgi:hypothetical protein